MQGRETLEHHLADWAGTDAGRAPVASVLTAVARAAVSICELIGRGPLEARRLDAVVGANAGGDRQKLLDVRAHDILLETLRDTGVSRVWSEESDEPVALDPAGALAVALDPLDGSSNIDANVSIGTIVSAFASGSALPPPGSEQLAAGFVVYGPHTSFVFSVGDGTHIATLDRVAGTFLIARRDVRIPEGRREYAINASNFRFWEEPVRAYVDDCVAGADGPMHVDYNMRWIASLVAEAYRILMRGGVFLYPRDSRPTCREGRLRLVYEANPIAFLVEQAGGGATDGARRILDIEPADAHMRTGLVFGSRDKVARVARYHTNPALIGGTAPLFGKRGLFTA